jgi:23S rRNA pseudouridine2604 synthase
MRNGIEILGTITQKCFVKQESKNVFKIVLTQGLNRQIRRMCASLQYQVTRLIRVRIMNITLAGIETGKWRYLSQLEIEKINTLVADSIKTKEGSLINANKK